MSNLSLEQRVIALEAKVAEIEEQLRLNPDRKPILSLFDRPPPKPEDVAADEEVNRYIREARQAELAEFDRQMEAENGDAATGHSR